MPTRKDKKPYDMATQAKLIAKPPVIHNGPAPPKVRSGPYADFLRKTRRGSWMILDNQKAATVLYDAIRRMGGASTQYRVAEGICLKVTEAPWSKGQVHSNVTEEDEGT